MKVGTKSLLFGSHQFIVHPFFVAIAWYIIYKKLPSLHEWCAIITHDWGYWGSSNMDGEEGENHPEHMFRWWLDRYGDFGDKVAMEIVGHSRFFSSKKDIPLSKLFRADKMSVSLYPKWLYLLLGNLSGEIKEYMRIYSEREGKYIELGAGGKTQLEWLIEMQGHMALMGMKGENYQPVARQMNRNSNKEKKGEAK